MRTRHYRNVPGCRGPYRMYYILVAAAYRSWCGKIFNIPQNKKTLNPRSLSRSARSSRARQKNGIFVIFGLDFTTFMKAIIRDCKKNDLPAVLELIKTCGLFWEIGDRIDVFEKKLKHDPKSI